ncbi:MAG: hypothetical protein Q4C65_04315 [Eubacteriales bacterium]|nr:hypothetical protein [Eubacteriales bacterium]
MEKKERKYRRMLAVQQWKGNFPLWISGTLSSAILVFLAVCWAFQERGWHAPLIAGCAAIALFWIGKKSVCPDRFCREQLEMSGVSRARIRGIIRLQMAWMYLAAVPAGVAAGLLVRPLLC